MRVFVGLELSTTLQSRLAEMQRELRGLDGLKASWPRPENLHVTLAFLGDVKNEQVDTVMRSLDELAERSRCFEMRVLGVGVFGSKRKPRVVWAGVQEESRALERFAESLRSQLVVLGFPNHNRPFRPHVTLARVRSVSPVAPLTALVASATTRSFGSCRVTRVAVFQSILHPQGSRYQILHASPLKGA